ncbi:inositol hexakisphosphate kinase 3 [Rhizophlyctis rosea]|nr:inositol hexakisphosphate kinase 3 [Rhizophlyctis rosea]
MEKETPPSPPSSAKSGSQREHKAYSNQVAGHAGSFFELDDGYLAKKAVPTEIVFYELAQAPAHRRLCKFMPKYGGTAFLEGGEDEQSSQTEQQQPPPPLSERRNTQPANPEPADSSSPADFHQMHQPLLRFQSEPSAMPSQHQFRQNAPTRLPQGRWGVRAFLYRTYDDVSGKLTTTNTPTQEKEQQLGAPDQGQGQQSHAEQPQHQQSQAQQQQQQPQQSERQHRFTPWLKSHFGSPTATPPQSSPPTNPTTPPTDSTPTDRTHHFTPFLKSYFPETEDSVFRPWLRAQLSHLSSPDTHPPPQYIKIENLMKPYSHPSITDVKIGTRLYDDDASPEKRAQMEFQAKTTTTSSCGVQLCGMKVWDPVTKGELVRDRKYGRMLLPQTLGFAFQTFFSNPTTQQLVSTEILHAIRTQLVDLYDVLQTENCRLYTSSLLLIYEGDTSPECKTRGRAEVRLIDFAHAGFGGEEMGRDEGALFGVSTLISILDEILRGGVYGAGAGGGAGPGRRELAETI